MCSYYYFSRHYQIAVKIKPLYLTHYACYLTSNTTRVVQQEEDVDFLAAEAQNLR